MIIKKSDLLTPKELLKAFPECGMTTKQIGMLHFVGAVRSIKWRGQRTCWIDKNSFEQYLDFKKDIAEITFVEFSM